MTAPQSKAQKENQMPPQVVLLSRITALWLSKAIGVAAQLSIPDLLKDGPKSTKELAEATRSDEPSLYRLLRTLAAYGIFSEDDHRVFRQSELSNLLRSDIARSMRNVALMTTGEWEWKAWGALEHSIRTGNPAFNAVYGKFIWQYLAEEPDHEQIFSAAMSELSSSVNPLIVESYDSFSRFHTLVDIGGGEGSLLMALLAKYAHLKGILFDRPSVIESVQARLAAAGLLERCSVVGGDMLVALPGGADAYLLKSVLHNWSDTDVIAILSNCHRAGGPGTTLLIVEQIIRPGGDPSSSFIKLLDLQIMAVSPGRERTEEEFRELLRAAGFTQLRCIPIAGGYCMLEGRAV